jgi:hypothetical protein
MFGGGKKAADKDKDAKGEGESAVDPVEGMDLLTVPAGSTREVVVPIPAGADATFAVYSEGYDCGVAVTYEPRFGPPVVVLASNTIAADLWVSGGVAASQHGHITGGKLRITLDNSSSWMTAKSVRHQVETSAVDSGRI